MRHYKEEYVKLIEEFVSKCRLERNTTPTLLEITKATGIPKTTAARYLEKMTREGIIVNTGSRRMETRSSAKANDTVPVPVMGRVSCGPLKDAIEDIEEYVRIPRSWCGPGEYFALRANGDSMMNAGISNGDIVIVHHQNEAETGKIVVALVDNENATLKRYRPLSDGYTVELVPENDAFQVQTVDLREQSLTIQGVAVKVVKDLN